MATNINQPSGQGYQPGQSVPVNQHYLQRGSLPVPPPYQPEQPDISTQNPQTHQPSLPSSSEGQWADQAGPSPGHYAAPQEQSFSPSPVGPPPGGQQGMEPSIPHFDPPPQAHQASGTLPPSNAQAPQQPQDYPPPPFSVQQGISHTGASVAPPLQFELPEKSEQGPPHIKTGEQFPPPPPGPPPTTASGAYLPEKRVDFYAPQTDGEYPSPAPMQGIQPGQLSALSPGGYQPALPPRRPSVNFGDDDPNNPIHYSRDPHKLVGYLVPFPKPIVKGVETAGIPDRFLIYTPPPPPLSQPKEGEKEDKLHKLQRKWQEEVREAKTSDAKTVSWKGVKGKATKGISYVMSKTTSSNLDFVNRIPGAQSKSPSPGSSSDLHAEDGVHEGHDTHKTVGLEEMILVYPPSYNATPEQVKVEFVNTMMRTKTKAQKDAVLATGLLPVSAAIDIMATLIWPFGGLLEIDGVWAYSSIRGAKTARSVTKRLTSSTGSGSGNTGGGDEGPQLHLTFKQSPRLDVLDRYLGAKCQERDRYMFPRMGSSPTETEVLNAIGWAPSISGGEKNWEDEQWETQEVKEDMQNTLGKAAKEWEKWCKAFAKDPAKALKK